MQNRRKWVIWCAVSALLLAVSPAVRANDAQLGEEPVFFSVTNLTLRPAQVIVKGSGLGLTSSRIRPIGLSTTDEKIYEAVRLTREDKLDDAMAILDEVLATDPENRVARTTRSIVLTSQFRYGEAVEVLEGLCEDFPKDVGILNNLAWVFATASDRSLRDGVRAVELAKSALISSPRNFHIWSTLSEGYYVTGDFQRASDAASEALKLGIPANASAKDILIYREQLRKAQRALLAFQLVE